MTDMKNPPHTGILWIISAPSGAGKTSLSKALLTQTAGLRQSVSYTTRSPRPGEINGQDYHFVDSAVFADMVGETAFLEHAEVFGNRYGTGKAWVSQQLESGMDVLLEIDWQGAQQVRAQMPEKTVTIFILPPSLHTLETRLRNRGQDTDSVIAQRCQAAQGEMRHFEEFDYLVINDDFSETLEQLKCIICAERARLTRLDERMKRDIRAPLGL